MKHNLILLDQLHIDVEIDPTITAESRRWLLLSVKNEVKECLDIAKLGVREAIPREDRNKFRFKLTK